MSGIVLLADLAARWPISIDRTFGCALWTGKRDSRGIYGVVWRGRRPSQAHRVVYEAEVGVIPEGLVLDHLCRRPLCVSPIHLEPISKDENEMRKSWRYRARRATCPHGHDLKLHAMITQQGGRVCRACLHQVR